MSRLHQPPTQLVASIPRPSTGEMIHIALLGSPTSHIDLRVFSTTPRSRGEPRPSRAGLTIRRGQLTDLIAALRAAQDMIAREGGA